MKIDPAEFGIPAPVGGALRGGDAAQSAEMIRSVLAGAPGARRDITLINAAAALWVAGAAEDIHAGCALARESIDSGAANQRLEQLIEATAAVSSQE